MQVFGLIQKKERGKLPGSRICSPFASLHGAVDAIRELRKSGIKNPFQIDPENENFGNQADSPALKLGREAIDVTKMGLQNIDNSNCQ